MPNPLSPFSRPVYVMAKPVGAACNLACRYCYYLEKGAAKVMSDKVLEEFIRQYIEIQTTPDVLFTWHGGEPMLAGLDFYRRVVKLQRRYANGRNIDNSLQTNGTLLTAEWCRFLHDEGWLVGISIDGPQALHDVNRRSRGDAPSWERVMRGIDLLNTYGVEWNAMATVNASNMEHPVEFYQFFRQNGCRFLQFTPVVERERTEGKRVSLAAVDDAGQLVPYSVNPEAWGRFLCEVFDQWVYRDVGELFVQIFDATLAGWMGMEPGICTMAETCGHAAVIEADGTLYTCDHFVFPRYRLGNIGDGNLLHLLHAPRQHAFGRAKRDTLPRECRECRWLFACHGECPRNRFATDAYGEPRHNYLCAGYRHYFAHVAPAMDFMRRELLAGRPPANIMQYLSGHTLWPPTS